MGASRIWPEGAVAPFGLLLLVLTTTPIGYQDLASLMAQHPDVTARARRSLTASPFGTIHAALFTLPQPLGTAMPQPPRLVPVSYDPRDVTASLGTPRGGRTNAVRAVAVEPLTYPAVDRTGKGDRLIPRWGPLRREDLAVTSPSIPSEELDLQQQVLDAIAHDREVAARPAQPEPTEDLEAAVRFEPFAEYDISLSLEAHPQIPDEQAEIASADQPDMSIPTRRPIRMLRPDICFSVRRRSPRSARWSRGARANSRW